MCRDRIQRPALPPGWVLECSVCQRTHRAGGWTDEPPAPGEIVTSGLCTPCFHAQLREWGLSTDAEVGP